MALNEQQEVFAQHYALSRNATESAKAAGYSERSANNQGARLLKNPEIVERIEEISSELTTNIDVTMELEKQYLMAKANGHGQTAIKALEMLGRIRGATADKEPTTADAMEKEIIRCMEILGEEKVIELVSRCNWNYSQPTEEELEEAEELVKKQTVEDKD